MLPIPDEISQEIVAAQLMAVYYRLKVIEIESTRPIGPLITGPA
jgi:hypothetical protein